MVRIGKGLNRCPECLVPKELCYCSRMFTVENHVPVSIIMHKRERFLTSNTAVVANRTLKKCEIIVRGIQEESASANLKINPDHVPLVLFPSKDAMAIGSTQLKEYLAGRTPHLIVPDGTWGQAKRVARREPALKDVQAVMLSNTSPSLYRLRRQVMEGRLCTFEAIARALGDLESLEVEQQLMKIMAMMDHAHAMARGVDKFDDGNPDPLTQRLFVGIRVARADDQVKKLQKLRPDFDWVSEENYHLTLAFIGRLRRSQKENLIAALKTIHFKPFTLNFNRLDSFKDHDSPSVLWLKPQSSSQLLNLAKQVREIIKSHGIPFDDKEYTPHWTLARTRGAKIEDDELSKWFELNFSYQVQVQQVVLFEGHGSKEHYREEAIFPADTLR